MKKELFKKVFSVDNPEVLTQSQSDKLLMCSTKNWNHYFTSLSEQAQKNAIYNELINVELIEFSSKKSMFTFLAKLSPKLYIDFSVEHEKPCVLKFA